VIKLRHNYDNLNVTAIEKDLKTLQRNDVVGDHYISIAAN